MSKRRKRTTRIKINSGKAVTSKPMAEVKCAFCNGKGKDPFGLLSVLADCQVCIGKGTVRIEEPYEKCPVCHGTGVQYNRRLTCLACGGRGVLSIEEGLETCPECGGSGKGAMGLYCLKCKGKGKIQKVTKIEEKSVCA